MSSDIMYVRFEEDTGKIIGISPKPSANHHDIAVDLEEVVGILQGKERRRNYRVEYDPKKKQLALVNVHEMQFDGASVNDFIYELPENNDDNADITVLQDIPNSCWKILLGKSLNQNLKQQGVRLNREITFSVTAKHDPNVLYKTLSVDFSRVVRDNYAVVPFDMKFEEEIQDISVFTAKMFEKYSFQRITQCQTK